MVETFKVRRLFGWRVRDAAGVIVTTDPAASATADAAMSDAEYVCRLMMTHFGIVEDGGDPYDGRVYIDAGKVD